MQQCLETRNNSIRRKLIYSQFIDISFIIFSRLNFIQPIPNHGMCNKDLQRSRKKNGNFNRRNRYIITKKHRRKARSNRIRPISRWAIISRKRNNGLLVSSCHPFHLFPSVGREGRTAKISRWKISVDERRHLKLNIHYSFDPRNSKFFYSPYRINFSKKRAIRSIGDERHEAKL